MKIVKFPQCYLFQLSRVFTISWYDESIGCSIGMATVIVKHTPKGVSLRPDDEDKTIHAAVREQVKKAFDTKLHNSLYY